MDSKSKISWEFLKEVSNTLDSYKIRNLIDAKNDIISSKVYNEEQYYQILFKLFDEERKKFALLNYLNHHESNNFESIRMFSKHKSISIEKSLAYLELLKNEGLIDLKYSHSDNNNVEKELDFVNYKNLSIKSFNRVPSEMKQIYEPVNVIFDSKNCSGCGLCAGVCPVSCINIYNGFGKLDEEKCIKCGLCYYFCPRTYLPVSLLNMTQKKTSKMENFSKIGHYLEVFSARTKIKEISDICQDGGITSTCLYYLFDNHHIDLALGAQMSRNLWRPEPLIIKNKKDVLKTAGTKYVNNPTLRLLNELNKDKSNVAVVGVPCMMQALLKSQIFDIGIPSLNKIQYRIGIFCMESFSYESLLKICESLDVEINDVKKTDINKGKFIVYTQDGEEFSIPIKEITHLAREDCEVCYDLTSESADISIGSIGSPSGWNTVIIRTSEGKRLFESLIENQLIEYKKIEEIKPGLPLLEKIATSKKTKCLKNIAKKANEKKRVPHY